MGVEFFLSEGKFEKQLGSSGSGASKVVRPASGEIQLAAALMGGVGAAARVLLAPAICLAARASLTSH